MYWSSRTPGTASISAIGLLYLCYTLFCHVVELLVMQPHTHIRIELQKSIYIKASHGDQQ